MTKHDESKRLQFRLFYFGLLGCLFICLLVSAVAVVPLYNSLKKQELSNLEFQLNMQQSRVNQYFRTLHDIADQITSRTRIRQVLEQYNHTKIPLEEVRAFTASKLEDAMAHAPQVEGIHRFDQKGQPVVSVGRDLPSTELFNLEASLAGASLQGPLLIDGNSYFVVSAPITNRADKVVGYDICVFNIHGLEAIMAEFSAQRDNRTMMLAYRIDQGFNLFSLNNQKTQIQVSEGSQLGQVIATAYAGEKGTVILDDEVLGLTNPAVTHGLVKSSQRFPLLIASDSQSINQNVTATLLKVGTAIVSLILLSGAGLLYLLRPLKDKVIVYQEDLRKEIHQLQDILPICMHCKKIRDDQGYWGQVESYIAQLTDLDISHGICEECLQKHYPEYIKDSQD